MLCCVEPLVLIFINSFLICPCRCFCVCVSVAPGVCTGAPRSSVPVRGAVYTRLRHSCLWLLKAGQIDKCPGRGPHCCGGSVANGLGRTAFHILSQGCPITIVSSAILHCSVLQRSEWKPHLTVLALHSV